MTPAELAVLSLLVERPRHGYEIERVIDERGMRSWTDIGFSSIYYLLDKMRGAGLVEAVADPGQGRGAARKVYEPTAAGLAAWSDASLAALRDADPTGGFLVGLQNAAALPTAAVLSALRQRRDRVSATLTRMRESRAGAPSEPWSVPVLFDYSETMLESEAAWIGRLVSRLEREGRRSAMPRKLNTDPEIVELPDRTALCVHTRGVPGDVGATVMKALYGAAYTLKFAMKKRGEDFRMEAPRARWHTDEPGDPAAWEADWALFVPDGTTVEDVEQKVEGVRVDVCSWPYGAVGQILHVGEYADEAPTIERLREHVEAEGWEVFGPHEEEYLSQPGAKTMKTMIRFRLRRP